MPSISHPMVCPVLILAKFYRPRSRWPTLKSTVMLIDSRHVSKLCTRSRSVPTKQVTHKHKMGETGVNTCPAMYVLVDNLWLINFVASMGLQPKLVVVARNIQLCSP